MRTFFRSRYLSGGVLFFFLFFLSGDIVPQGDTKGENFAELLEQGKMFYAEKDYENAVIRLLHAHQLAGTDAEKVELYSILSRVYFDFGERETALDYMRQMLELAPETKIDGKTVSSGYGKLFHEARRLSEEDSPQIAGMRFREELKKKKRLNRIELFVTIGILVVSVLIMKLTEKKSKIVYDPDYDTRVVKIEWVTVPEGEFSMGDDLGGGDADELSPHMVKLTRYEISKFEITYEQYDLICREAKRTIMANAQETVRGSRPVLVDSWDDASFFCRWLAQKTGKKINLPTEAQWEKAARGTDQRKYPWGNTEPNCGIVNFNNCVSGTRSVGSYPAGASPYGVMDMAGNAMEWTGDRYLGAYSKNYSSYLNPSHAVSPTSPAVVRGGDYKSSAFDIRAMRRSNYPLNTNGISFRVCKE